MVDQNNKDASSQAASIIDELERDENKNSSDEIEVLEAEDTKDGKKKISLGKNTLKFAKYTLGSVMLVAVSSGVSFLLLSKNQSGIADGVKTNSDGLQSLYAEIQNTSDRLNNVTDSGAEFKKIKDEHEQLKNAVSQILRAQQEISVKNSSFEDDIEDLTDKANRTENILRNHDSFKSEVESLKKILIQKNMDATKAQQAEATNEVANPNKPEHTSKSNLGLRLITVDRWAGIPQAVMKTEDGVTIFMNQGERRNGWQLSSIDLQADSVFFVNGTQNITLSVSMQEG